jgi:hypothetical protein
VRVITAIAVLITFVSVGTEPAKFLTASSTFPASLNAYLMKASTLFTLLSISDASLITNNPILLYSL